MTSNPKYDGTLLTSGKQQLEFWTGFNEYAKLTSFVDHFSLKMPRKQNYYDVALKASNPYISLTFDSRKKHIRVSVYMKEKSYWAGFANNRDEIEKKLSFSLDWQYKPETKRSYIQKRYDIEFDDPKTWEECYKWFIDMAIRFKTVFSAYC